MKIYRYINTYLYKLNMLLYIRLRLRYQDHIPTIYIRIPISRTSKGNKNWFKKSGVRESEGGIKCG